MSDKGGCGEWYTRHDSPCPCTPDRNTGTHLQCSRRHPCPECAAAYRAEHGALKEWFHQIETDASDVYAVAMKELDVHNALRAIEQRKGDG